jgi:hypothetical protein
MVIAVCGCSSMSVTYDYDKNVTWEKFTSYAWLAPENAPPVNPASNQLSGDLLEKRIHQAVASEMDQRSIKTSDDPAFMMKYFLGTEDKVQVTDWGYRYSDYYWGAGGRQIDVYQFTQGTLVIDIIDAQSKTLVWRGTATDVIDTKQKSPEEMQQRVNNVVHEILKNFPPQ